MVTQRTLCFYRDGDVALNGDLYLPDEGGASPVVVAVPGGGWRFGTRKQIAQWGRHLAQNGIAMFAVDYRQATDGATFPKNVQDVRAAIDFIRREGTSLSVDTSRLGLLGASAGAHLAALAALAELPDAAPLPKLSALIGVYGIYDLARHWQSCRADSPGPGEDFTDRMMGITPYDNPRLYFDASPISHVTYAKKAVKTLLIWGKDDHDVRPRDQSEAFALALRQAHFFVRTMPLRGAGHFWFSEEPLDDPRSRAWQVAPTIIRFLKQHLADPTTAADFATSRGSDAAARAQ